LLHGVKASGEAKITSAKVVKSAKPPKSRIIPSGIKKVVTKSVVDEGNKVPNWVTTRSNALPK
jgi:hypothetical protein